MHKFEHKHVLTLRGVCLDGGPAPYIIMPLMATCSLLAYLKNNRSTQLVSSKEQSEVNNIIDIIIFIHIKGIIVQLLQRDC